MNAAETAAVVLGPDHPKSKSSGERKIPPPTPTIPERRPTAAPHEREVRRGGRRTDSSSGFSLWRKNIRAAASRSTSATTRK
ncbi:MAG: hypothetical protein CNCCGFBP_01023 [Fimbriimonadaceae bacterium]|nr:hypothetical protein [Fimbriimonadaceae bacterium]